MKVKPALKLAPGSLLTQREYGGLRALDLCAGAGGLSLGLVRAGFTVLGVEIDCDACGTHCKEVGPCDQADLWAYSPLYPVDLVAGGLPCQSHSAAGLRGGMHDPRGQLYVPFLRIAREACARAILIENVRGLLTSASPTHETGFEELLDAVWKSGFSWVHYRVLDAADFGVPQHRYRLFVVGFASELDYNRFRWPSATHYEGGLFGARWVSVREALGLGECAFTSGLVPGASWDSPQGARMLNVERPSSTVNGASIELLGPLNRPSPTITATEQKAGFGLPPLGKRRRAGETINPALGVLASELARAGVLDRPATTVDTKSELSAAGHHTTNKAGAVRLSIEQLAALQGFPEGFVFCGGTSKSRHKQVGNAVPPALGAAVGSSIFQALEG